MKKIIIDRKTDCLLVTDVQNDFCPGGALGVSGGDKIVGPINKILKKFGRIAACQDWHPRKHCSFRERGGPWPPHCIRNTWGADFHPALRLPKQVRAIKKASHRDRDTYSAFCETPLEGFLKRKKIRRFFISGLTTEYCVKLTALDALRCGFEVLILEDLICPIRPAEGRKALAFLKRAGARMIRSRDLK